MSSAAARFFNGCRALMAPAKSAVASKTKPTTTKKPSGKSPAKPKTTRSPAQNTGFLKPTPVSPALANFLGASEASRADAVRQIWSYIKAHNLQNPLNKREIVCDAKLKAIFDGKNAVGFLEIGKLLSHHFVKTAR